MKVIKDINVLHPILINSVRIIQSEIINKYNIPIKIFETGREHDRQQLLLHKGQTHNLISRHSFDLSKQIPLYATAVDFVYFFDRWSWNLRDNTIFCWYNLFGNLVLDKCPELSWGGTNRKATNYTHFQLKKDVILNALDRYPCIVPT